ncbi:diadenylate cyclase [Hathewaya proteolytica DSM 3090]|uniref:DNA integrity scanning protein DisA n=1 Tax=Hathewaya proteolytica DSM 3090 TaxID=1121331 RepID=A0A1M6T579_9CLOT|nr:DNA integrity scanning diadenylate cyclase DisA [Hathewaya proteolytica]SHK52117.1 diadenylate cyclase [Hathewaya proteolytica DSM 3090]
MRINKDRELMNILKLMAPGTLLREGLENILRAKTGGLIVIGDKEEILKTVDGGFNISAEYTPAYVYELAKMDGAIVLTEDVKKILYANTQLMPEQSISTGETGTRHRTADRLAKQTGAIVIAISQRRNIITVYKGAMKYILKDSSVILAKANQAIQTLEKYISVLDRLMLNLNLLEFQDLVSLFDVLTCIQRIEMVMRIVEEIERYICELGNEGRLISMQLSELIKDVEEEEIYLIRDYCKENCKEEEIYINLQKLTSDEVIEIDYISKTMGYLGVPLVDTLISPRGYRMLGKIPRLPSSVVDNLVLEFKELKNILEATHEQLDKVDGIGEARARAIKQGLKRLRNQYLIDR